VDSTGHDGGLNRSRAAMAVRKLLAQPKDEERPERLGSGETLGMPSPPGLKRPHLVGIEAHEDLHFLVARRGWGIGRGLGGHFLISGISSVAGHPARHFLISDESECRASQRWNLLMTASASIVRLEAATATQWDEWSPAKGAGRRQNRAKKASMVAQRGNLPQRPGSECMKMLKNDPSNFNGLHEASQIRANLGCFAADWCERLRQIGANAQGIRVSSFANSQPISGNSAAICASNSAMNSIAMGEGCGPGG
jgi:hypothetical protein